MTGVQTCALPICFPVTIATNEWLNRNTDVTGRFIEKLGLTSKEFENMPIDELKAKIIAAGGTISKDGVVKLGNLETSIGNLAKAAERAALKSTRIANAQTDYANGKISAATAISRIDNAATGGLITSAGVRYRAGGGIIPNFKPMGTDTIPAMLTPGEFVVNKQATRQNIGLLHAINNGDVQYRNKGGGIAQVKADEIIEAKTKTAQRQALLSRLGITEEEARIQARKYLDTQSF